MENYMKLAAFVFFTFYINISILAFYYGFCHGKSNSHAVFFWAFAFVKSFKYVRQIFIVYAFSIIFYDKRILKSS